MKIIIKLLLLSFLFSVMLSCTKEIEKEKKIEEKLPSNDCCPDGNGLFAPLINSGDIYKKVKEKFNDYESIMINENNMYKDYASFVEIDPNKPNKEYYWFTSSRFDTTKNLTDFPAQLYYCERNIKNKELCPSKGWSDPIKFTTSVNKFNDRTFGTIAISGDVMIVSAEQSLDGDAIGSSQLLNLWMLKKEDKKQSDGKNKKKSFAEQSGSIEPKKLDVLNTRWTWESQPTLSKDGQHLFFISDRSLDTNAPLERGDLNIWYSKTDKKGKFTPPVVVNQLNTDYNEYTPQFGPNEQYLYFASNRPGGKGGYDIYAAKFIDGKIGLNFSGVQDADVVLNAQKCGQYLKGMNLNTPEDDIFPFFYRNPNNNKFSNGIFWTSSKAGGYGNLDNYACGLSTESIKLEVVVLNAIDSSVIPITDNPYVNLYKVDKSGRESLIGTKKDKLTFPFDISAGMKYHVRGGACIKKIRCEKDEDFILMGYNIPMDITTIVGKTIYSDTSFTEETKDIKNLKELPQKGTIINEKPVETDTTICGIESILTTTTIKEVVDNPVSLDGSKFLIKYKVINTYEYNNKLKHTLVFNKAKAFDPDKKIDCLNELLNGQIQNESEKTKNCGVVTYGNNECVYKDTIYVIPVLEDKSPCRWEFTEYWADYRKRVPYFQTAFWEVNTRANNIRDVPQLIKGRRKYTSSYSNSGPVPPEGWNPWNVGAKWIELHKNNSYWNTPEKSSTRRAEYRGFARTVDKNLEDMAHIIGNKLLPAHNLIHDITPGDNQPTKHKFMIYVEAWSDYRPVTRGWYIPKNDDEDVISYASGSLLENNSNQDPGLQLVKVEKDDPLGGDNDVLSDLRAYFGYLEVDKILKNTKYTKSFSKYTEQEILYPHELVNEDGFLLPKNEIHDLYEKAKIIILAKGYSTIGKNEGLKPGISEYVKERSRTTYYNLDTVRTITVIIEPIVYIDGYFIQDDCCIQSNLDSISFSEKHKELSEYKVVVQNKKQFIISFGSYNSPEMAEEVKNKIKAKIDRTQTHFQIAIQKYNLEDRYSGTKQKKYRIVGGPYNSYNDANNIANRIRIIDELDCAISMILDTVDFSIEYGYNINLASFTNPSQTEEKMKAIEDLIKKSINDVSKSMQANNRKKYKKLYNSIFVGAPRVKFYEQVIEKNKSSYYIYIGPFAEKRTVTTFIKEILDPIMDKLKKLGCDIVIINNNEESDE